MSGLNDWQLIEFVIEPVLEHLELNSHEAVQLLVGTAKQESRLEYIKQLNKGPALGIFQMEPATHDDIWNNFLRYREELADRVRVLAIGSKQIPDATQMIGNLFYATAMCRVHYLRVPKPLPAAGDVEAQGTYWKTYYNTPKGRGTIEEYVLANSIIDQDTHGQNLSA